MNPFQPSEATLHAYVDGQLNEAQQRAVDAYLTAHPAEARKVAGWQQDAQQLRALLANLGGMPVNPQLDPQVLRRTRYIRQRRHLATAAALFLALGLGSVGGWQARNQNLLANNPPMQDALEAHRLFALDTRNAVDVRADQPAQLQAWLDQRFQHASRLPDLGAYGLQPVGGRLLNTDQGPAALLLFEDAQGQRISLYLRSPGALYDMPNGERRDGELQTRYWSQAGYSYALVSPAGDSRAATLQKALSL